MTTSIYKKWSREEDVRLLRADESQLTILFPDIRLDTLKRRRRMLRAQPALSDGVSLGLSGVERVSFDTNNFTAFVIGDLQVPFQNKEALAAFSHLLDDTKVDVIINDGDHFDNYAISRYQKDKRRGTYEAFKREREEGLSIFGEWRTRHSGDIILLKGNHEERWENYVMNNAEDIILDVAGEALNFDNVFDMKRHDVITFPYMQPVLFGDTIITHGTRASTTTPGSTALKEIRQRFGTNVIVGHCHSGAMVAQRYVWGTAVGIENFTMANLDGLGYAMFPNWCNGFTHLRVVDGKGYLTPVPIQNNTFIFNGKLYTPRGAI